MAGFIKNQNVVLFKMKIYITYKYKDANLKELKEKLEEFSEIIENSTGWEPFIFFRDVQKWKKDNRSIKDIFSDAISHIKQCDAVLVEASEKANGIYFEVGYAKALNKKIIVIHKKGTEANLLEAMSDIKIEYDDFNDLKKKLSRIKI